MSQMGRAENNEKLLISKYFAGDEKSLEVLVNSYLRPIYSFVYRYVGNKSDAEEIVQDTFVKMWRNLKRFDESKSFKTWIFTIAKNTAFDFLKKKRPELLTDKVAEGLVDTGKLPNEIFEQKGIAELLSSALSQLSPKYRMVLFLRYNDHFTFREIAETMGEGLDTVKSRHLRALGMLRKLL